MNNCCCFQPKPCQKLGVTVTDCCTAEPLRFLYSQGTRSQPPRLLSPCLHPHASTPHTHTPRCPHRRPASPRLMQVRVRPPLGCGHPPLTTTPGLSTSRARSRAASLVAPDARPVNTVTTLRSSALPPKTRETLVRPQAKICKQTPSLGLPRATVLQSPRSPLR